jgi:hypothetical protein
MRYDLYSITEVRVTFITSVREELGNVQYIVQKREVPCPVIHYRI